MIWNLDRSIKCVNINCDNPAEYRRIQICKSCYGKQWRAGNLPTLPPRQKNLEANQIKIDQRTEKKTDHLAEILFAQKHPSFIYQPATFHLSIENYSPDFYDSIENIFYEIIGSRQRFNQLKDKLKLFKVVFPNVKLKICCGDGKNYHSTQNDDLFLGMELLP